MDASETRVAFYLPSFERGGVERLVVNLSKELLARGTAVDVLIRDADEPMLAQLPARATVVELTGHRLVGRLVHRILPKHVANAVASLPDYVGYLRRSDPDLLVSMQTSPFAVLGARLARTDATVVVRESNTPSAATASPQHTVGRLAPLAKRLAYPRADRIVAVSADAGDDIAEWLGVPRDRIRVIYNPTSNEGVVADAEEPVSHPWYDDGDPIVVSVGRFADQKDFETLLHAIEQTDTEPRLVLVGDGDNREDLEALADRLDITDRISFVGYQDNPYPYMEGADLFVLSSHYEGLPNVVIEALTVGTPVVATDCPSGPREILLDGEGGHLVPVGDVNEMTAAIDRAFVDTEGTAERLRRAQESLDRFTPEQAASAYLELIDG